MNEFLQVLQQMDASILLFIQDNIRNAALTPIMTGITHLGDKGILWIVLSVILLIPRRTRRAGVLSIAAMVITFLICNMWLKNYVARTRPYEVINGLQLLVAKADDFSFPSGHASSSFAAAVSIWKNTNKGFGIICIIMASLIAFSRLYIGIHYPSDVIAGLIIGTLVALILFWIFGDKKHKRRAGRKLAN